MSLPFWAIGRHGEATSEEGLWLEECGSAKAPVSISMAVASEVVLTAVAGRAPPSALTPRAGRCPVQSGSGLLATGSAHVDRHAISAAPNRPARCNWRAVRRRPTRHRRQDHLGRHRHRDPTPEPCAGRILKQGPNLFESLTVAGRPIAQNGKLIAVLEDRSEYAARKCSAKEDFRQPGQSPSHSSKAVRFRAVVKIEGVHKSTTSSRRGLPFTVRFTSTRARKPSAWCTRCLGWRRAKGLHQRSGHVVLRAPQRRGAEPSRPLWRRRGHVGRTRPNHSPAGAWWPSASAADVFPDQMAGKARAQLRRVRPPASRPTSRMPPIGTLTG